MNHVTGFRRDVEAHDDEAVLDPADLHMREELAPLRVRHTLLADLEHGGHEAHVGFPFVLRRSASEAR